jgi:hypothetical protein
MVDVGTELENETHCMHLIKAHTYLPHHKFMLHYFSMPEVSVAVF